jgi:putative ABC transport system permease protein
MRLIRMFRMRARALWRGDAVDRELAEEMRVHLDQLTQEQLARGMTPEAAREAARSAFGPVTQRVEESREARGIMWIANGWQDMRYGVRLMTRAPGFAVAVVLTVALGIGATTAMFSVVYGVVLQPLPYRDGERLVNVFNTAPSRGLPRSGVAMANVLDWKARNHVLTDIGVFRPVVNFNLTGEGEPERLFGSRVSANLFSILGVAPLHGRLFLSGEDTDGRDRVVILAYGLWKRRFGADPAIVGRTIALNGQAFTVVGVMREGFAYPTREYQIYAPLTFNPTELVSRMNYNYLAVARLAPGVTLDQARAELSVLSAQIEREHPAEAAGIGADAVPMLADTVGGVRTPLYILLGAVAAMLLIGCANLANLLLARALGRERELAMRTALGASRGRLILQSMTEIVPMLVAGGAIGLVAAAFVVDAIGPFMPSDVPRVENIGVDWIVLGVTAATLAAIGLFVSAWPALEASRVARSAAGSWRGNSDGRRRTRMRDGLAATQIAATLCLLVAATLLMRSLVELRRVNPGFNAESVYTVHVAIPRAKYPRDIDVAAFGARILERVRLVPSVVSAGLVNRLPLAGGVQTAPIEFEGLDSSALGLKNVDTRSVTPDYFRTLQIPLVRGRAFLDADDAATRVAIIDDRLAMTIFGTANPIGHRVRIPVGDEPWQTIVGVVGHIRHDRLEEDARPQIYFSFRYRTQDRMALAVRTTATPSAIAPALVAAIRSVDPEQPVYEARTLGEVVDRSLAERRLQTVVLAAFASMALLLASIGVYGVIAYAVGQRRREFGIRLALGARRGAIVRGVLGRGLLLFAAGSTVGLVAAAVSARVLGSLLFNISGFDPVSFAAATVVLFLVTLAACALPARRAAGVDPSIALRTE